MSDSSRCQYEQSRCHSSDYALYTVLFSLDKWTRAVWKSLSWIKLLNPKPLFFLSFPFSSVHPLRSQTSIPWLRCPHPVAAGLILEWFRIASWIAFQKIPQEDTGANSFNLHVYLNRRHGQIAGIFQAAWKRWGECCLFFHAAEQQRRYTTDQVSDKRNLSS